MKKKLIEKLPSYFKHEDERGGITGINNSGSWEEFNFITSIKDTMRGNHYHKETTELFYIIEGHIKVSVIDCQNQAQSESFDFHTGDTFKIFPNTIHTFEILEDSKWINFLDKKMDSKKPDIHRV